MTWPSSFSSSGRWWTQQRLKYNNFCMRPKPKDLRITWVVFLGWSIPYQLPPPCYPFIFPSVTPIYLSPYLSLYLSITISIYLSIYLSPYLSTYPSIYHYFYLSIAAAPGAGISLVSTCNCSVLSHTWTLPLKHYLLTFLCYWFGILSSLIQVCDSYVVNVVVNV